MPKRLVRTYINGPNIVKAVQWDESPETYKFLTTWTDYKVRAAGSDLVMQLESKTVVVQSGDYIVKVGDYFHVDKPETFERQHVKQAL